MSREFVCDLLGVASLFLTTAVMLYLPAILQA